MKKHIYLLSWNCPFNSKMWVKTKLIMIFLHFIFQEGKIPNFWWNIQEIMSFIFRLWHRIAATANLNLPQELNVVLDLLLIYQWRDLSGKQSVNQTARLISQLLMQSIYHDKLSPWALILSSNNWAKKYWMSEVIC